MKNAKKPPNAILEFFHVFCLHKWHPTHPQHPSLDLICSRSHSTVQTVGVKCLHLIQFSACCVQYIPGLGKPKKPC